MDDIGIQFNDDWHKWLSKLDGADLKRVNKAIVLFQNDPDHSSLNLEKMIGTKNHWWTIRASKKIRIAIIRSEDKNEIGQWTFCRAGYHDDIDKFVSQSTLYFNKNSKQIGIVSIDTIGDVIEETQNPDKKVKGIFDHWDRESLIEAGIPEEFVDLFLKCESEDDFFWSDTHHEVPEEIILLGIDLLASDPETWTNKPEAMSETERYEVLTQYGELSGLSKFFKDPAELSKLLEGEIEKWMVWLHPDQASVVNANYAGPARIAGAAGTGKTSVALHRAKKLVEKVKGQLSFDDRQTPKIAFITYNNNQPNVLRNLYKRIPGTDVRDIEFITLKFLSIPS